MTEQRTFTYPDRPVVVVNDDGSLTNPEGWETVLVASDRETVVAAWDEAGAFWQWEDTETIVTQLLEALVQTQQALTELAKP